MCCLSRFGRERTSAPFWRPRSSGVCGKSCSVRPSGSAAAAAWLVVWARAKTGGRLAGAGPSESDKDGCSTGAEKDLVGGLALAPNWPLEATIWISWRASWARSEIFAIIVALSWRGRPLLFALSGAPLFPASKSCVCVCVCVRLGGGPLGKHTRGPWRRARANCVLRSRRFCLSPAGCSKQSRGAAKQSPCLAISSPLIGRSRAPVVGRAHLAPHSRQPVRLHETLRVKNSSPFGAKIPPNR